MYELTLAAAEAIIEMETAETFRPPTPPPAHRTGKSTGPLATSTPRKDEGNDYIMGLHQFLGKDKKPTKNPREALDLPSVPGIDVQVYPCLVQMH